MTYETQRVIYNTELPRNIYKETLIILEISFKQVPEAVTVRPTIVFPIIFLLRKTLILISIFKQITHFYSGFALNVL